LKKALLLGVAVALLAIPVAQAAQKDDDDIVILAVKPRSPDVKPIAAAVSPNGQDTGKPQTAQANIQVSRR
jgi:hypothetical protein